MRKHKFLAKFVYSLCSKASPCSKVLRRTKIDAKIKTRKIDDFVKMIYIFSTLVTLSTALLTRALHNCHIKIPYYFVSTIVVKKYVSQY